MDQSLIIEIFGTIGLLLCIPTLFRVSYMLTKLILNKFSPTKKVVLQHIHDGVVMSSVTLRLDIDTPVVRQIESIQNYRKAQNQRGVV